MTERLPLLNAADGGGLSNAALVERPRSGARLRKRLRLPILGGALISAFIVVAIWIARPDALPALAAFGASASETGGTVIRSLQERLAGHPAMERPDPVRNVRAITVRLSTPSELRSFTGFVAARYETPLAFRVSGKIVERIAEVGQAVSAGDALMRLDPADYRAALAAAEANLAAAKAQARQAMADERRQSQLLQQGWTTQAAYDRVLAVASSSADQVKAAAEQTTLARNSLSYTELKATHDGVVTELRAEAGQVVPQGQPVVVVVRPGDRDAVVNIPEGHIDDIRGWAATASFWPNGARSEPAILREIAPQADSASRTYRVRFALSESASSAGLGSTVTIALARLAGVRSARLPASAVLFRDGQPMVWRATAAGRLEAASVELVRMSADEAVVRGLANGDRIVTLGVHRLDPGATVRIIEDTTPLQSGADAAGSPQAVDFVSAPSASPVGQEADAICMGD
jgi:membrane fusion protein, multidrug efflux system